MQDILHSDTITRSNPSATHVARHHLPYLLLAQYPALSLQSVSQEEFLLSLQLCAGFFGEFRTD